MAISHTQTGSSENAPQNSRPIPGSGIAAAGGVLGALAASLCCLVPLGLFTLGVGGAWVGNLTALAPYQPFFFAISLCFTGTGFYLVYRRRNSACADASACARHESGSLVKTALWGAALLVLAAITFPYYAPLLIGD